jgi:hypothetical protein
MDEQEVTDQTTRVDRSAGGVGTEVRRVNVNFSREAYDALLQLAEERGVTMSTVLRDAIAMEKWLQEEKREGAKFLIKNGDEVREVLRF